MVSVRGLEFSISGNSTTGKAVCCAKAETHKSKTHFFDKFTMQGEYRKK
jgi:hypothetical protein